MSLKNISLDVEFVRSHFPAFKHPLSSKWSFFENAGGSYVPQTVIDNLSTFMISTKVQPYAEYDMTKIAGNKMDKAKDLISSFKNPIVKNVRHSGHTLLMEKPNEVLDYLIEIL